jgi:predicted permease
MARRSPVRARLWYWRQAALALLLPVPGAVGVPLGPAPGDLARDLRQGLRALRRRPGAALAAILPLGLGIGVVATAFSIVWGTVLAGLPFEDAGRLVHFERARPLEGQTSLAVTPHDYLAWRGSQRSFVDLGAYVEREVAFPRDGAPPERYDGVAISARSFGLLRVDAALGRAFTEADMEPGAPAVILLGHRLWTARFGADPGVIGRDVVANGRPTTVVGVMPPGFGFPIAESFWLPLQLDPAGIVRGQGRLDVFGRLRPGVDLEAARREFDGITGRLAEAYPDTHAGVTASLRTFHDEYVGEAFTGTVVRLVAGAVLVLLVCCANVANLLLIRGFRRRKDLAVRRALGATGGALVRQLLAEAAILSAAGAALGVGLAAYGVAWFNRAGTGAGVFALPHGSDSLFWWDVGLNGPTLAAAAAVAGVATLLAGLLPALRVVGAGDLGRRGARGSGPGAGRLQRGIVLAQLALTAGLLVAAGFVTRSVGNVSSAMARWVDDDVRVLRLSLPSAAEAGGRSYGGTEAQLRFVAELEDRLAADPAVSTASFATAVPLDPPRSAPVRLEGEVGPETPERDAGVVTVSPAYFDVFGVAAEQGRVLERGDRAGTPPVAVVNRSFAERHLPGRSPLGARIRLGGTASDEPWLEIVGVIPDLWEQPGAPDRQAGVYLPLRQVAVGDPMVRVGPWGLAYPSLALRESRPGAADASLLGGHVFAMDPALPIRSLESMADVADRRLGRYRVWGRFWLAFAAATLLLAALGVYGVLSFHVTVRTAEIGVRRALGASVASVQREVVLGALREVALGVTLGLGLGSLVARGLGHVLYGVDDGDPAVFLAVALLVTVVALGASWLPARRAARIDPRRAMRAE